MTQRYINAVTPIRRLGDSRTWGWTLTLDDGETIDLRLTDTDHDETIVEHLNGIAGDVPRERFDPSRHCVDRKWIPFSEGEGELAFAEAERRPSESESMTDDELLDELRADPPDVANALGVVPESRHQWPGEIYKYVLGGNATFTIVFGSVLGRRTFKVKSFTKDRGSNWSTGNQDRTKYWVSLKTGPGDGWGDYQNIGRIEADADGYMNFHAKRNADGKMHFAAALFDSFWTPLDQGGRIKSGWEFYHATSCCVCGRKLTVPESIVSGIGPECAGR